MKQFLIAGLFAVLSLPVAAQGLFPISRTSCTLLVMHLETPDYLRPDLGVHLDGMLLGITAAGVDPEAFEDTYVRLCNEDPVIAVDTVVRITLEEISGR